MFSFEEDSDGNFAILFDGNTAFEVFPMLIKNSKDELRGMVACMVDALNKERGKV